MPPVITQWVPNSPAIVLPSNIIYNDINGNPVYQLYPYDYLVLIGQDLNNYINTINAIAFTLSGQTAQIQYLTNAVATIPAPYFTPQISPKCLGVSGTTQGIDVVLSNLLTDYCSVTSVLGTNNHLLSAVGTQCQNLGTSPSFTYPRGVVGALPYWVGNPGTVADTLTNLWVVACDSRAGISNLYATLTPSCSQVIVNFEVNMPSFTSGFNLYFNGYTFIPTGYVDNGSSIRIVDSNGNQYITSLNIVTASVASQPINIATSGTTIQANLSYTVYVTSNVINANLGLTCIKTTLHTLGSTCGNSSNGGGCCPDIGMLNIPIVSGITLGSYSAIGVVAYTPRFVSITNNNPTYIANANNFSITYIPGGFNINWATPLQPSSTGILQMSWMAFR